MPFIENDHAVEQIAAAVADSTLGDAVLPWAAETPSFRLDAETPYRIDHLRVEAGTTINDRIAECGVARGIMVKLREIAPEFSE